MPGAIDRNADTQERCRRNWNRLADGAAVPPGSIGTTDLADDAVTFAKMQNITTDRLLGRDTSGTGNVEQIAVGGGIEFTGAAAIRVGAYTGDVTKTAGGTVLTIGTEAVTASKIAEHAVTGDKIGITTTKGDIIAYDGATAVRVPVGTNGKSLLADSTATPGVVWSYLPTNGLTFTYTTNVTMATGPAAGKIKFDSTTLSSITEILLSITDINGNAITNEMESWDNAFTDTKGILKVSKSTDATQFALFLVTGTVTDTVGGNTSRHLSLTHLNSNGSWADNSILVASFQPFGAANPVRGTATLSGGTITVLTGSIKSDSLVMLTPQNSGSAQGHVWISARVAATSFDISSTDGADDRLIGWMIIDA